MDSTALTSVWLDAFRRVQSATAQHFARQMPQPAREDRALTDVIASAIQTGGAGPDQVGGGDDPSGANRRLDLKV